jgi:1-acyl-sn-glycerol-3-phosphate acyltransferase
LAGGGRSLPDGPRELGSPRQREPLNAWYVLAVILLKPLMLLVTRRSWSGVEHVPADGGVIVAANHVSVVDPIVVADYLLFDARLVPRFMAKSSLFRGHNPVARIMRGAGQIPVERHAAEAGKSVDAGVVALAAGRTVMIYPEGTTTRDPQWWPMAARTGVARLALQSGAPVLPLAHWGSTAIHRRGEKRFHLLPPKRVQVRLGPPVDLSAFRGRPLTVEVLRGATEAVMAAITAELELLRGEAWPGTVHDPRADVSADRRPA